LKIQFYAYYVNLRQREIRQVIFVRKKRETGPIDAVRVYLLNLIIGRIRVGTNCMATMYNNENYIYNNNNNNKKKTLPFCIGFNHIVV